MTISACRVTCLVTVLVLAALPLLAQAPLFTKSSDSFVVLTGGTVTYRIDLFGRAQNAVVTDQLPPG